MWNNFTSLFRCKDDVTSYTQKAQYKLPEHTRLYVLGDVHGCNALLTKKIDLLYTDLISHSDKRNIFIGLGDYVDRGPDSHGTIETLLHGLPSYMEKVFLKGNHEVFMYGFLNDAPKNALWLEYGGIETLRSYGVSIPKKPFSPQDLTDMSLDLRANMPEDHLEFLATLHNSYEIGDYFFAHAGIDPEKSLEDQTEYDLTSIRKPFIQSKKHFEKCIVHGHTPCEKIERMPQRINLDTGAYLTGNLSLAVIENDNFEVLI